MIHGNLCAVIANNTDGEIYNTIVFVKEAFLIIVGSYLQVFTVYGINIEPIFAKPRNRN